MRIPGLLLISLLLFSAGVHAQVQRQEIKHDTTRLKNGRYHKKSEYYLVKGHVRHHRPRGKWVYKSKDYTQASKGQKWRTTGVAHFRHGQYNGNYVAFDLSGDTTYSGRYKKGKMTGEWRYFDSAKLYRVDHYDTSGNRIGWQYNYYTNGAVSNKSFYTSKDHYYSWYYNEHGTLLTHGGGGAAGYEGTWYRYSPGARTVPADTLPVEICEWKHGKKEGWDRTYVRGQLTMEVWYHEGFFDGPIREFSNGILIREENRTNGKPNGESRYFTHTGKPSGTLNFEMGIRNGMEMEFDTATGIAVQTRWLWNENVDSMERRLPSGVLIQEEKVIDRGAHYFRVVNYYDNGMKKDSGEMRGDLTYNICKAWYPNGIVQWKAGLQQGLYSGGVDAWNENGIHVFHAEAMMGYDTIPEQTWSETGQKLSPGTKLYRSQLEKYKPAVIIAYNDNLFFTHTIIVKQLMHNDGRSNGEFKMMELMDTSGTQKRSPPHFPGGSSAQYRYFMMNLRYPQMEKEQGKAGVVLIEFTVNADSTISDVRPVKKVLGAPGLSKESERVVKSMPKWIPARKNGKVVESKCVMEIRWVLEWE